MKPTEETTFELLLKTIAINLKIKFVIFLKNYKLKKSFAISRNKDKFCVNCLKNLTK